MKLEYATVMRYVRRKTELEACKVKERKLWEGELEASKKEEAVGLFGYLHGLDWDVVLLELPKEDPKPWILQVDESTTRDASRAGLILTSPKGQRLSYALRFEFKATNDEAEYEASVVGLELASAVGASHVLAKSDSQLVVGQVLGEYTVKKEVMQKYLDRVKAQIAKLQSFNIVMIPSEENIEADYLAKLAMAKEDAIPQNAPVRYLELPSIFAPDIQSKLSTTVTRG
ncbi:hypothetical protein RHSIM_Rhsim10G0120400 [Rhododendron simsii]|uniref:RNase H type-1 domain-containing protein n=1 Tax=Rhododendron simsii TaxID=118357 RepID=A0A834GAX9_RHOSS|nr:hypothetical protein RHSIM_Rhsim10G0120400 [Rhododendron simsii]